MTALIGYVKSEGQICVKSLLIEEQSIETKIIDAIDLKDQPFNLLITGEELVSQQLNGSIDDQTKFYPVVSSGQINVDLESFNQLDFSSLNQLYHKVNSRWVLSNNIHSVEQIYPTILYFKDLWEKDRDAFFEELWFFIKSNLATQELSLIFHDIKASNSEKEEKPELCYSTVYGNKIPNLREASEDEAALMKDYDADFAEALTITEHNAEQNRLVATSKIGLSPILIMAKVPTFNQLQQSVMIALFSALADN